MKFDVQSTLLQASSSPEKRVVCVKWAPDGERLAIATADRIITLFPVSLSDPSRLPVKARDDSSQRAFTVSGLAWSPDSTCLAIAQTDGAVAVYDIGAASATDHRKRITMRFSTKSAPIIIEWPVQSPNDFVYGTADGAVFLGATKSKRTAELYRHTHPALSIASPSRMNSAVIGHSDGQIFTVSLESGSRLVSLSTTSPPLALAWGSHVLAAGADLQLSFADQSGSVTNVDYSNQPNLRAFTAATFDPSGTTAIVGAKDSLLTFNYSPSMQTFSLYSKIDFTGLGQPTSISWSPDGSRIAFASSNGLVSILSASLGSFRYKDMFEVVRVTSSHVRIVDLHTKNAVDLKSSNRILKTTFRQGRYAVCRTTDTLLVADTKSGRSTEFPAAPQNSAAQSKERLLFVDDLAALAWSTGELTVADLTHKVPTATLATQYASPLLLSLRYSDRRLLAYLVDAKTVRVVDLDTSMAVGGASAPYRIDWLELNPEGTLLLFRDSRRTLYLLSLSDGSLSRLASPVSYAQWVPGSSVAVAQTRKTLLVWYSPHSAPAEHPLESDVVDIRRDKTGAEAVLQQGSIRLDGSLVAYSAAMERGDLKTALTVLSQNCQPDQSYDNLWRQLGTAAEAAGNWLIAEAAAASLGDISRSRYLHKINKLSPDSPQAQSLAASLQGSFKRAEYVLVAQGDVDGALSLYRGMGMWDELLDLAALRSPQSLPKLREEYIRHLISTNQFLIAARVRSASGETAEAVDLCLQAGKPQAAAEILLNSPNPPEPLLQHVSRSLMETGQYEAAGRIFERMGRPAEALSAYRKGSAFSRALELARATNPSEVVQIEKEWADSLAASGRFDAATFHYAEAGDHSQALNCALRAQQWNQAADILRSVSHSPETRDSLKLHFLRVARHFAQAGDVETAEDLLLAIGAGRELVDVYLSADRIDDAIRHGKRNLKSGELETLLLQHAKRLEKKPATRKEAEKLYTLAKRSDLAVEMWLNAGETEEAVRAGGGDKRQLETIARQAEKSGDFEKAEGFYEKAGLWKQAAFMYRQEKRWFDSARICLERDREGAFQDCAKLVKEGKFTELSKLGEIGHFDIYEKVADYMRETGDREGLEALLREKPELRSRLVSEPVTQASHRPSIGRVVELERLRRYDDAIDECLSLTVEDCGGEDRLVQVYDRAVKIASHFSPSRLKDVVVAVAQQLISMQKHETLGKILEGIEAFADAFEIYKLGQLWEHAKRVSVYLEPAEREAFENEYAQVLMKNDSAEGLAGLGNADAAAQVYVKRGDWDSAMKSAIEAGGAVLEKYTIMYAQYLVDQGRGEEAVAVLAKYLPSGATGNTDAYLSLCRNTIYSVANYDEIPSSIYALRQMLFKIEPGKGSDIERFTRGVHLLCQANTARRLKLPEIESKAAIACLRYCDVIPADYLFYTAGNIMKREGNIQSAYIYFNRFIDIVEAINDNENLNSIDHLPYEKTDIPRELCLRKTLAVSNEAAEAVKDWVLEKSMTFTDEPKLMEVSCQGCGRMVYAANLVCGSCGRRNEFCHITGWPVLNPTECTSCGRRSNRADWGVYINKTGRCPCCDAPQTAGA